MESEIGAITVAMSIAPATFDVPKNPAERRAWVVYQLRVRGLSLRALAQREGVSHQAMSLALTAPSSYLETVIAEALGLEPQDLFPERYDAATGRRLCQTREPQRSTRRGRGNVQKEAAA